MTGISHAGTDIEDGRKEEGKEQRVGYEGLTGQGRIGAAHGRDSLRSRGKED